MDLLASAAETILGTDDEAELNQSKRKKRKALMDESNRFNDRFLLDSKLRNWSIYEFYYSTLDTGYYSDNEFVSCLSLLDLGHIHCLPKKIWGAVRGVMSAKIGRPRRFSKAFLSGERAKLEVHRAEYRSRQRRDMGRDDNFPYDIQPPYQVGNAVLVHDIKTKTVHRGTILSIVSSKDDSQSSSYFVRFDDCRVNSLFYHDDVLALAPTAPRPNGTNGLRKIISCVEGQTAENGMKSEFGANLKSGHTRSNGFSAGNGLFRTLSEGLPLSQQSYPLSQFSFSTFNEEYNGEDSNLSAPRNVSSDSVVISPDVWSRYNEEAQSFFDVAVTFNTADRHSEHLPRISSAQLDSRNKSIVHAIASLLVLRDLNDDSSLTPPAYLKEIGGDPSAVFTALAAHVAEAEENNCDGQIESKMSTSLETVKRRRTETVLSCLMEIYSHLDLSCSSSESGHESEVSVVPLTKDSLLANCART